MSDMKDDGGPAFPEVFAKYEEGVGREPGHLTDVYSAGGMTLRDYFAAAALSGFIASSAYRLIPSDDAAAKESYSFADAMIKERSKP